MKGFPILRMVVLAVAASAQVSVAAPALTGGWVSGHLFGGGSHPDPDLSHFAWDVRTRPAFGGEVAVGWQRIGIGGRVVSAENEQRVRNPLVSYSARVNSRTLEVFVPVRIVRLGGFQFSGSAGAGRMHLSYEPNRVAIPVTDGLPLIVDLPSIDTWTGSLGGALRHGIVGPLDLGLSARRRWFELDTAHRAGEVILFEKQGFGQWEVQAEVGWEVGL